MSGDDFYKSQDWDREEYPESWKADTGDFVGGIVKRYSQGTTEYRGETRQHPICILEVEKISGGADVRPGEEVGVWLIHTVLLGEFSEKRPKPGERVGIRKVPTPQGKDYHNYVVRVDRETEDEDVPDFDRYQQNTSDRGAAPGDSEAFRPGSEKQGATQSGGPGADEGPPPPGDDDLPF